MCRGQQFCDTRLSGGLTLTSWSSAGNHSDCLHQTFAGNEREDISPGLGGHLPADRRGYPGTRRTGPGTGGRDRQSCGQRSSAAARSPVIQNTHRAGTLSLSCALSNKLKVRAVVTRCNAQVRSLAASMLPTISPRLIRTLLKQLTRKATHLKY